FFIFSDAAPTKTYTLSYTTLFRSASTIGPGERPRHHRGYPAARPEAAATWASARGKWPSDLLATLSRRPSARPGNAIPARAAMRSEEHTSELQSRRDLVCRLLLEK